MEHYRIAEHGFELVAGLVGEPERRELLDAVGDGNVAGRRNMLAVPAVAALAKSKKLLDLVQRYTGGEPRPVRAIWFNKSPGANWLVAWHQDLAIPVRERVETPGFGAWSVKEGVPHVQPPVEVLERMLTVRIHLDNADEWNGALRVIPESHRLGRLDADQIASLREGRSETLCAAAAGDALLMRPLLLHASGRSTNDRSRRVLHLEYAGEELPGVLEWRKPD
ncbi:phytanoyl-CoA dioxygenase family protein [Lacipirellula limnantheis]|uniref:Phytanoyl-CoA dioxygenase (PhyH) n=1 Tax=Lacipirellula limnantheis TaxID=2528024 RepID=A0A517U3N1_9BACT|nr:phytanoyl-CoA dioxygenase family protein [Lacipirellula limnantheis]QDT75230.1 Phytanoyl-CoA dioxygenase (PhyH) [Lacipirellula limnantheis]